jgi:hypothetical protein
MRLLTHSLAAAVLTAGFCLSIPAVNVLAESLPWPLLAPHRTCRIKSFMQRRPR